MTHSWLTLTQILAYSSTAITTRDPCATHLTHVRPDLGKFKGPSGTTTRLEAAQHPYRHTFRHANSLARIVAPESWQDHRLPVCGHECCINRVTCAAASPAHGTISIWVALMPHQCINVAAVRWGPTHLTAPYGCSTIQCVLNVYCQVNSFTGRGAVPC
jgi:hypothetical protein